MSIESPFNKGDFSHPLVKGGRRAGAGGIKNGRIRYALLQKYRFDTSEALLNDRWSLSEVEVPVAE